MREGGWKVEEVEDEGGRVFERRIFGRKGEEFAKGGEVEKDKGDRV